MVSADPMAFSTKDAQDCPHRADANSSRALGDYREETPVHAPRAAIAPLPQRKRQFRKEAVLIQF
jgi:hypothetical protein